MTFWSCAVAPGEDAAVDLLERFRRDLSARPYVRSARAQWHEFGRFVAAVGLESGSSRGELATYGAAVAVGVVRLDNRDVVARSIRDCEGAATDLELVLRYLAPHLASPERAASHIAGREVVAAGDAAATLRASVRVLLGDFAFVAWHPDTRRLIVARDAFGVRKLFCAMRRPGLAAFGSRAELLAVGAAEDAAYDIGYLVGLLSEQRFEEPFGVSPGHGRALDTRPGRTAFAAVQALPAGGLLTVSDGVQRLTSHWSGREAVGSGGDIGRSETGDPTRDRIDTFRSLLMDAVRVRLDDPSRTWCHLSGGLDSSSVVCVAEYLAQAGVVPRRLGGTVSFIEPAVRSADERVFSDAVVRKYGITNQTVPHVASWREAIAAAPRFDQPNQSHLIAVRDQAAADIIRRAGGSILLTGSGGDQLLLTTMFFFADWLARGHVIAAARAMAHWAALGRVSFWELAYKNAVLPLLPAPARRALMPPGEDGPTPWLRKEVARRYGVVRRRGMDRAYGGRRGHKYEDALVGAIATSGTWVADRFADEVLELRHPFLYRPLVEFALGLPPEMCARPHARKWILREAMRGILPDEVRTRVGKAGGRGMLLRSVIRDRAVLLGLLRDPLLAQLGCIEPGSLRHAVENAGNERRIPPWLSSRAVIALEIELWLRLRAGKLATEPDTGAPRRRSLTHSATPHTV